MQGDYDRLLLITMRKSKRSIASASIESRNLSLFSSKTVNKRVVKRVIGADQKLKRGGKSALMNKIRWSRSLCNVCRYITLPWREYKLWRRLVLFFIIGISMAPCCCAEYNGQEDMSVSEVVNDPSPQWRSRWDSELHSIKRGIEFVNSTFNCLERCLETLSIRRRTATFAGPNALQALCSEMVVTTLWSNNDVDNNK